MIVDLVAFVGGCFVVFALLIGVVWWWFGCRNYFLVELC